MKNANNPLREISSSVDVTYDDSIGPVLVGLTGEVDTQRAIEKLVVACAVHLIDAQKVLDVIKSMQDPSGLIV